MRKPVVVIPGYYGSILSDRISGEVIWLDGFHLAHPDDTLDALSLDSGHDDRIVPTGILDEVFIFPFWTPDVYKPLITFLRDGLKYEPKEILSFRVDWRKSIDIAAADLDKQIHTVLAQNDATQVDIIAHSHGGLVARRFLQQFNPALVDNLITLGVPHHGMLKTFMALDRGIGFFTFSPAHIRDVSRSFPSAYELLPQNGAHGMFVAPSGPTTPFANNTWALTPKSKQLLADAAAVVQSLPQTLPVKATFIYGTHQNTTTQAAMSAAGKLTFVDTDDGDGTVPRVSAAGTGLGGNIRSLPIPYGVHSSLFNYAEARTVIKDVLMDRTPQPHFAFGFESGPMFRPRTTNELAVELRDASGAVLPNANVRLKILAPKVNQPLSQSANGDFVAKIKMPGPGQHFQYEITADSSSLAKPIVRTGVLFAGNF